MTVKGPHEILLERVEALEARCAALEGALNALMMEREAEPGILEAGHQRFAADVEAARERGAV